MTPGNRLSRAAAQQRRRLRERTCKEARAAVVDRFRRAVHAETIARRREENEAKIARIASMHADEVSPERIAERVRMQQAAEHLRSSRIAQREQMRMRVLHMHLGCTAPRASPRAILLVKVARCMFARADIIR